MSETETTIGSTIISALETSYLSIRTKHSDLPSNVVFILGNGAKGKGSLKLGHWHQDHWAAREGTEGPDRTHELLITGECLARGARQTMQTLVHEAAHALATVRDIKDTSRQNRYHNGRFRTLAEELGMEWPTDDDGGKRSPDSTLGFSCMELTDTTVSSYSDDIERLDDAIRIAIDGGLLTEGAPTKATRQVIRCTFESGDVVDVGLKKYEELAEHLADHDAELVIL